MRYFGERSLSSVLHRLLQVSWVVVVVLSLALNVCLAISMFALNFGDPFSAAITQSAWCASTRSDPEWNRLLTLPWTMKLLVFPYLAVLTVLLLFILRNAQQLFENFSKNVIFRQANVTLLCWIGKLLIAFSILSVNFTSLLLSPILLMLCEILKNGTTLQEEQDLTV